MSHSAPTLPAGRVPAEVARRWQRAAGLLAAVGAAASLAAFFVEPRRFAFSYLVGFAFVATLGVGGLIFILLQHLTRAGWSAAARRQMEWLAGALPLVAALFVPLALLAAHVYEWLSPEALADPLIAKKHAYLNAPAFFARAAVFFAVWSLTARWFGRTSRRQDNSAEPDVATARMQRAAAPAVLATGVTLSFAGFDWLMSLDPRWYSTIFGVYVIAGSIVSSLALLALGTLALERRGVYGPVSTVEHRHDIGKLLFGFTVFWAYIAFCQYFLIWYANIPEETIFFRHRWVGSWQTVSLILVFGHFVVPFVLLLSRYAKRSRRMLGVSAALLLGMHYVDLYWLVMPTLDRANAHPSWIDGAALLLPVGVLLSWLARRSARDPAYPLRDPRLPEAIRLENF
jgi:hypothetical protein